MPAEIEVKYLIEKDKIDQVRQRLNADSEPQQKLALENLYFDTAEQLLGKHKMGLRIRRWNDQCEQTLKTSGYESGGVSKRPEYNAPCTGEQPDLLLFDAKDITWPEQQSAEQINARLQVQFIVRFEREIWQVDYSGTEIEVALDQGQIQADKAIEPICELELELKQGKEQHLHQFASELAAGLNLQPGTQSKAQRGYLLLNSGKRPG